MSNRFSFVVAFGAILLAVEFSSDGVIAADHASEAGRIEHRDDRLSPVSLHYNGSVPIDLDHGLCGNNGTFGLADPEYESLRTAALTAPGLLAAPYEYRFRSHFLSGYAERIAFFDEAIHNLNEKTELTKPEAAEFSHQAAAQLTSLLEQAKKSFASAKSAGANEWMAAQAQARDALNALLGTYTTLTSAAR